MSTSIRPALKLVPALAATAVLATAAPSASADALPTVWLNAQGTLSYTGTASNDIVDVDKGYSALFPGGWYIEVETRESGRRRTSRPTAPFQAHRETGACGARRPSSTG